MKKIWQKIRRGSVRLYSKIIKEKATPEYIARGWAIGMFYGCLIPFGFQLACSVPTAFILKGSKIGACLGTLLTNHVTIFFIYPVQCYVGDRLIGGGISYEAIKNAIFNVIKIGSYEALWKMGLELFIAFFVGGALLTAVTTPITYYLVKKMVVNHRRKKAAADKLRAERQGKVCIND